jgi:hypothetical protein
MSRPKTSRAINGHGAWGQLLRDSNAAEPLEMVHVIRTLSMLSRGALQEQTI